MENLDSDEMPPRWMWHLDWELETHFKKVKEARETKYGTKKDSLEIEENAEWEDNIYASRFK